MTPPVNESPRDVFEALLERYYWNKAGGPADSVSEKEAAPLIAERAEWLARFDAAERDRATENMGDDR